MNPDQRAVSPIVGTLFVVAIVFVVAATIGVTVFGLGESINEPAPVVSDTTGEFEPEPSGPFQQDNQFVRITHSDGDGVAVGEMEIIVQASGPDVDSEARLFDLPDFDEEDPDNLIMDNQRNIDDSDVWSAGDTISFRINTGTADFREDESPEANTLEITIIHTESNAILSEHTFNPQ